MKDEYSPVPVGTGGTVKRVGKDPFDEDEMIIQVQWDNGSSLSLVSVEDIWMRESDISLKKPTKESIQEQDDSDYTIDSELSRLMPTIGPIPKTKMASSDVIQKILSSEGFCKPDDEICKNDKSKNETSFNLYSEDGMNLNKKIKRLVDRIRFYEYFESFKRDKDGRGFNFEGMLAGLLFGEPIISQNKEDIKVDDDYYSVKLVQPGERFDLGSLSNGFNQVIRVMTDEGYEVDDLKTPKDLMLKNSNEYDGKADEFKRQMMEGSFNVGIDEDKQLKWLFAILNDDRISYTTMDTTELIEKAIQKSLAGKSKSSIAVPNSIVSENEKEIVFPVVDLKKLQSLGYRETNKRKDDKISDLFGKYNKNVRFDIIQYIRKNPDLFLKRVIDLYGDRLTRIMKEKGLIDLPNKMDESKIDLINKLSDNDIDPSVFDDLLNSLTDEDITDLFLRNLDRKLLKSGDKNENIRKYISKYVDSLKSRGEIEQDPSDDYDVEDEFLYGGVEPEKSKIGRKQFKKELMPLQVELLKLQEHVKETGKPVVVVMEGRDSAGKGSTIRKMTEYLDPKYYNIVALGIPTPEERKDWFGRYEKHIEPGKITFFDRSWYNRGIVEPVMGYGTEEEYFDFMENVNGFEQSLKNRGVELFKFWLSITPQTQQKRFELRKNSPLKYWKFSPNDEKSIDKWDDYTEYKEKVLKQTKEAQPWTVVDSNDKRAGTLNLLRHILQNVDYKDKDVDNLGTKFPEVVTTVNEQKGEPSIDTLVKMIDIFKYVEKKVFFDFLKKIRQLGIVNMLESGQFLISGREYLKKFIEMEEMRGREFDEDMVEEVLDLSEQTKNEIIQATFKIMEDKGIEDYSMRKINQIAKKLSRDALTYYITMFSHTS